MPRRARVRDTRIWQVRYPDTGAHFDLFILLPYKVVYFIVPEGTPVVRRSNATGGTMGSTTSTAVVHALLKIILYDRRLIGTHRCAQ